MHQQGGKLIGTGSKTCIFKPNIPCSKQDVRDPSKISKIYVSKKNKLTEEMKINKMIESLENSDQWAIVLTKTCKHSPNFQQTYQYDKDILSCIDKFNVTEEEFNKYRRMTSGPYGGISMNNINQLPITKRQLIKPIHSKLNALYIQLKPLFYGLKIMNQNKIVHLDIKPGNILLQDQSFKYIDFGITRKMNNIFLKQRSLYEFNTTRIYLYYPYEYIYLYAKQSDLDNEEEYYYTRSNFHLYEFIHKKIFKRNIKNDIRRSIQRVTKVNKMHIIQKLDVYSLGITIIKLFIMILTENGKDNDILKIGKYFQKPFLKPLVNILRRMTEPLSINRCTAEEAYELFVKLL
jgi:serine/threonine protein kinase